MTSDVLATTRRSLHGIAETILAGTEHRAMGRIRLVVTSGGFATLPLPGSPARLAVRGTGLVVEDAGVERTIPLAGTFAELADVAGLSFGAPEGVYHDGSGVSGDDQVDVDPRAAAEILRSLSTGDAALRRLAAAHHADDPVLWPEHFDVGITVDEVNYGVSAGDATIGEPYAYVGPWKPRSGDFWDQPFGSARTVRELGGPDDVLAYFETGLARAAADPVA
jgi:hypothetical protein